jgi:hypothetical protein
LQWSYYKVANMLIPLTWPSISLGSESRMTDKVGPGSGINHFGSTTLTERILLFLRTLTYSHPVAHIDPEPKPRYCLQKVKYNQELNSIVWT